MNLVPDLKKLCAAGALFLSAAVYEHCGVDCSLQGEELHITIDN